jgi:excisionase family DNA binding protein
MNLAESTRRRLAFGKRLSWFARPATNCNRVTLLASRHFATMNVMELENHIPITDVASRLSVSRRTVERWIASGRFPRPLKIGGSTRFAEGEISEFLKQKRITLKLEIGNHASSGG